MADNELTKNGPGGEAPSESELVHMLYDAVIDNSLWPEMTSELLEYIERARKADPSSDGQEHFQGLVAHFQRAVSISQNFVKLQEQNSTLDSVLNNLSVGISLYDHSGRNIFANSAAEEGSWSKLSLQQLLKTLDPVGTSTSVPALIEHEEHNVALVPAAAVSKIALPAHVAYMATSLSGNQTQVFESFQQKYNVSDAELRLLRSFHTSRNLRQAASACDLTYESARTYFKRIFLKTGVNDQAGLLALLDLNPLSLIDGLDVPEETRLNVRRTLTLSDGRILEYLFLGPENGNLVFNFDALAGLSIDAIGTPELYLPVLERLNLRLVTPCRPGTFNSSFKRFTGLSEFTPDLVQLLDHLGAERVTLLSQGYGSCSALALAATASQRVERLVLCAPSYPRHEPRNWREMDLFHIIGEVIGRRAPALLRAIIPFLVRSIMQNPEQYLQRHIARSKCPADIAALSNPQTHERIPILLALRTANGAAGMVQENYLNIHGWDFDLSAVSAPVHILQGALDNLSDPEGAKKLADALPISELHMLSDLGQYILSSQWAWILELCAGFEPAELKDLEPINS